MEILHLSNVKPYHALFIWLILKYADDPAVRKFIEFTKETIDIFIDSSKKIYLLNN